MGLCIYSKTNFEVDIMETLYLPYGMMNNNLQLTIR